jgi:hypothetical protein
MNIILQKNDINIDNISFKQGKNSMKLLYNLSAFSTLGIPLCIDSKNIVDEQSLLKVYLNDSDKDYKVMKSIDTYLQENIDNYESFLRNDHFVVIKTKYIHLQKTDEIYHLQICMNHIKDYNQKNKLNIYTI